MTNKELAAQCLIEAADLLDDKFNNIKITEIKQINGEDAGYRIQYMDTKCKIYDPDGKLVAETDDENKCNEIIKNDIDKKKKATNNSSSLNENIKDLKNKFDEKLSSIAMSLIYGDYHNKKENKKDKEDTKSKNESINLIF